MDMFHRMDRILVEVCVMVGAFAFEISPSTLR